MNVSPKSEATPIEGAIARSGRTVSSTVAAFAAIVMTMTCLAGQLLAADADNSQTLGSIRRAYVPADDPDVWPPGRWIARPIAEFQQLLQQGDRVAPMPPRATLRRVTYTGTWKGTPFLEGRVTAEAGLRGFEAEYLSLGAPTLSLSRLAWNDRPAVWGSQPDGPTLLRVEHDGEQLEGRWSLRGRDVLGDLEFDAELPPAVISRLELRLPRSKHVRVNPGIVAIALEDEDPEWRRWVIDLGRESQLHLVISDEPTPDASAQLAVQRFSRYRLLPDGLRFRSSFAIEHLRGEIDELTFSVPAEMPVSSIMLGNEIELPFRVVTEEEGVRIVVPLKSITLSSRVNLIVQGTMPLPTEPTWTLPRVSLPQATMLGSRMSISVHRPLELSDFSTVDCRLMSSAINRNQTDSLELEDWSETSQLALTFDTPQADVVSDIVSVISGDPSQSGMRTLLKLTTRSGSAYQVTCDIPDGWQITRATSVPWRRPNLIAQWQTVSRDAGGSELHLEFRDKLSPEHDAVIEIWARRVADPMSTSLAMPIIRPANSVPRTIALVVRPTEGQTVSVPNGSPYAERPFIDVAQMWSNEVEWDQWLADVAGPASLSGSLKTFFTEAPTPTDQLLLSTGDDTDPATPSTDGESSSIEQRTDRASPTNVSPSKLPHTTSSHPNMADVTVTTSVPAASGQESVHVATYMLPASAAGTTLHFSLSEPAAFISARVGGTREMSRLSEHSLTLQLPVEGNQFDVEIEYRTPFTQSLLTGSAMIPLPSGNVVNANLEWRLMMPPPFRMDSTTSGTSFQQSGLSWRQRLLGPLGRAATIATLRPSSRMANHADSVSTEADIDPTDSDVSSISHTRSVPFTAQELRLTIWKEDVARRVGWLLMVAACMTIGFIRRINPSGCALLLSLAAIVSGVVAALVPDAFVIPCGGLFFGTLSGVVLPQRLWSRRSVRNEARAESAQQTPLLAGASASLMIVFVGLIPRVHAYQDSLPPSPAQLTPGVTNPDNERPSFDVLIPVKSARPTLDETPVVYFSPELLNRWKSAQPSAEESPAWLLREAEYAVTFDQRQFPRMTAVFDVVVLDASATRQIRVPLEGIAIEGENACRVNGQVATIIPLRTGRGFSVDLTSLPAVPLPDEDLTEPRSPQDLANNSSQVLRIEIQCRLRRLPTSESSRLEVAVPPLLSAHAIIDHQALDVDSLDVPAFGSQALDAARRITTMELGPVHDLQFPSQAVGDISNSPAFVPESAISSVIVHPQRLHVSTRLRFLTEPSTIGRTPPALELQMPSEARVTDVRAAGLERWDSRWRGVDPLIVRLDFTGPIPPDSLMVELEYDLPCLISSSEVTIPAFTFLPRESPSSFVTHTLALTASPGFRIEHNPTLFQAIKVMRIPSEQFQQEWQNEGSLNPNLVFSLTAPQSLEITTTPMAPVREASISEQLTASRSQLQWEADVELNVLSAAVALHHVMVDPRLQISNISVMQDDADRLIRWTRSADDQLTLILSNEMTGPQRIHISGHIPMESDQITDLPHLSLPDATLKQRSLTLINPPDWRIETFDHENQPIPAIDINLRHPGESNAEGRQTLNMLLPVHPARIRVTEAVSTFAFDRITTVQAVDEEHWQVLTQFLLPTEAPLPPQIELIVPADLAAAALPTTSFEAVGQETRDDGSVALMLSTSASELTSRSLSVTSTIESRQANAWEVPRIEVPHGSSRGEWLILPSEFPYELDQVHQLTPLASVVRDRISLPSEQDGNPVQVFRSENGDWTLHPRNFAGAEGLVRRLDSVIWDSADGQFSGVTSAQVSVRFMNELTVRVAREVAISHVLWSGGDVITRDDVDSHSLILPTASTMSAGDHDHRLTLWWTTPSEGLNPQHSIPLPRPQGVPVITETIAFLGSHQSLYELTSPITPLENPPLLMGASDALADLAPIAQALRSAGGVKDADGPADAVDTIFVGRVDGDVTELPGSSMTVWVLNRQVRRFVLVALISALLLLIDWKTRFRTTVRHGLTNLNRSLFAGPILLAALLWMLGPGAFGFWMLLLCAVAWGVTRWQDHHNATSFEYTAPQPR